MASKKHTPALQKPLPRFLHTDGTSKVNDIMYIARVGAAVPRPLNHGVAEKVIQHGGRQGTLGSFTVCFEMAFGAVMCGLHGCSTGDRFVWVDEFLLVVNRWIRQLRKRAPVPPAFA